MTQQTLSSKQTAELNIDIIKINEGLCVFKAEYKSIINGVSKTKTSEGVNTLLVIEQAQQKCILPNPNKAYILKSEGLLELVRQFGHPATLGEQVTFNNSAIHPTSIMKEEIELSQITFDDALNNDILDELIYINYSNHVIVDIKNNTLINVAQHAENMGLDERKYKDYRNMIDKLIKEKRINIIDRGGYGRDLYQTHYDCDLEYVSAKIVFSDEEFQSLITEQDFEKQHIDNWSFQCNMIESNVLNIKENIKTKEEIEADEKRNCDDNY